MIAEPESIGLSTLGVLEGWAIASYGWTQFEAGAAEVADGLGDQALDDPAAYSPLGEFGATGEIVDLTLGFLKNPLEGAIGFLIDAVQAFDIGRSIGGSLLKIWPGMRISSWLQSLFQDILAFFIEQRTPGDPNDITGPSGFGAEAYVSPDRSFPYTIQFENKADATAPAQVVEVSETLDPSLDWNTFQIGDFGFGGLDVPVPPGRSSFSARLDLRSTLGLFVDVSAGLNLSTGEATWTFTSIDPATLDLPSDILSGFLPPDTTPPEGEAFINYTVRPKASASTGTVINAKATVIFDAGLPDESSLDTAPIFNTIDAGAPTSTISALPAFLNTSAIPLSWSGDDGTGSGIATYNVFVSLDGGPFTPFLTGTTDTSATFTGVFNHKYAFYSIATDNVGNVQPTPTAGQTTTQLTSSDVTPPTSSINLLASVITSTSFTLTWSGSDNPGGTGIASYDVYGSTDGGAFAPFLTHTTQTSAVFTGSLGTFVRILQRCHRRRRQSSAHAEFGPGRDATRCSSTSRHAAIRQLPVHGER